MKNKVSKLLRRTTSVVLAGVMAGSTVTASAVAAPVTSTTQSFSMGRVGTVLDNVKNLLTGDGPVKKDTHSTADTFSSKRLIVKADKLKNIDKKNVIASYDGYYLLKYDSKADAKEAYDSYKEYDGGTTPIAADQPVHMATGDADSGGLTDVTKSDNPLTELKENVSDITKSEVKSAKKKKVIALLDTGASKSSNVIETVSMLGGDTSDDNGHGEKMVKRIREHNKNAQIISIKVLDSKGEGSVSSIVAGIAYAEKRGASIINMSLSGRATEGNSIVTSAVTDAINKGLTVIGAAGNYGADAADYIPGSIKDALIVGACDSKGNRISSSNYGETVDYNVVADSTSEAVAITSGYVSANMNDDGSYSLPVNDATLFFKPSQNKSDVTKRKSNVTIASAAGVGDNVKVKLYSSGKLIQTLGKSVKKYSAKNINLNSMKITTEDAAISVMYPDGTTQNYTDKSIVVNVTSGNSGDYVISSLDANSANSAKKAKESFYKNPQSVKAMNDRDTLNNFQAQATTAPNSLSGYGVYEYAPHRSNPYTICSVHVDGFADKDVKWTGKAKCIRHGAEGSNGSHYTFVSSRKTKKVGEWQWYSITTFRAGWSWSSNVQPLVIQVAIRLETPTTERTVKKVWKDHAKDAVTFKLRRYKAGKTDKYIKTITLSESKGWTHTEKNLPSESSDGKKYTYKWIETSKFKAVKKSSSSSGTTDTWTNKGHPTPSSHDVSIDKDWVGNDVPTNVEILARLTYTHKTYNTNDKGKRTTLKSSTDSHKDYTLNDDNNFHADDRFSVSDKEKEEYVSFRWYEYGWRYVGETNWQTDWTNHPIPNWERGDAGAGYGGELQCGLNYAAPTTKMSIQKDWTNTEVADSIVFHLYGDTPEGTIDCGEVTLTKANGWSGEIGKNATIKCPAYSDANQGSFPAQTIVHDLPVYYTRTKGVLDFHVPTKYSDDGFQVWEEVAEAYKIKYRWVEDTSKTTFQGYDISKLIASCEVSTEDQPEDGDYDNGGSGYAVNTSVNPTITSYAVDSSTGTKAARVLTDSDGSKYIQINETVNIWNVGPGNSYTLTSGVVKNDGTGVTADFAETTFTPNQINTFKHENGGTFVSLNIAMRIGLGSYNPSGDTLVVTEVLEDDNGEVVAEESNVNNKDQMLYYPAIKTHMVSANPSVNYGHTMDSTAGDTDGKHYGTLQNSPDGTVTMVDTVTYENVYTGSYILDGTLHRKGRTTNTGQDLGAVTTASKSFNVSAGDGASSGTVDVTYTFNFPESCYGGDYVSFETLKTSGGVDIVDHADISDGKQTVRMPTALRVIKKDADTDKPLADVTYQLFTKDANGNFHAYKKDDGNDYTVTTGTDGKAEFRDLELGTYWVREIKVPTGYSLQAKEFEMTAAESLVVQKTNENISTVVLTTGGSGTAVYYITAALAAAAAMSVYVIKKRKQS